MVEEAREVVEEGGEVHSHPNNRDPQRAQQEEIIIEAPTCPPPPACPDPPEAEYASAGWGLRDCPQKVTKWSKDRDQRSQGGQDVEIYNRYFKNKCFGTFLEMGALNGEQFSNSWFFEKVLGWRGVCVEPNPITYGQLIQNRPLCIDVNAAVTSTKGTLKFMQVEGYSEALSGIVDAYDPQHIERIQKEIRENGGKSTIIDIPGIPLHDLLEQHHIDHVDFFSLDTEGSELLILKGIDWDRVSIDVIMVENNYDTDDVKQYMATLGYEMETKLGPDEVFVKKQQATNL